MSNLLDWIKSLDRDKEKKGFQILKPETRQKVDTYTKNKLIRDQQKFQRIDNRRENAKKMLTKDFWQRGFQNIRDAGDPGQYLITRAAANIPQDTKTALSPIVGRPIANDIGYGLRGATQLTPLAWANQLSPNSKSGQMWQQSAPKTEHDKKMQRIGRNAYGTILTAPIGGANYAKNIAGRVIQGGTLGGVMNTGKNLLTGEKWHKDLGKGIGGGIENSWQLAFTNLATDKLAAKFAPKLTSDALQKGGNLLKETLSSSGKEAAKQVFKQNAVNLFKRALLETPIENTWFTAINNLTGEDKRKFVQAWAEDFFPTLGGNLAYAGLATGKQGLWDLNKNEINAAGEALVNTYKKMFAGGKEGQGGYIKIGPDQKVNIDSKIEENFKRIFKEDTPVNKQLLQDFKDSYEKALKQSVNYEQFQKNLTADLYSKNREWKMSTLDVMVRRILPENTKIEFENPKIKIKSEVTDPLAQEYEQSMDSLVKQKEEPKDLLTTLEERQTLRNLTPEKIAERITTQKIKPEEMDVYWKNKITPETFDQIELGDGNKEISNAIEELTKTAEQDLGIKIPRTYGEQYMPHLSEKQIMETMQNGTQPSTPGDLLTRPFFTEHRTGKLKDYQKTPEAMMAFTREALRNRNLTPQQAEDIKISVEIIKGIEEQKPVKDIARGLPWKKPFDYVSTTKQNTKQRIIKPKTFNIPEETGFQNSVKDMFLSTAELSRRAGDDVYDTFFFPWRVYETNVGKKAFELSKLNKAELLDMFGPETKKELMDKSKDYLLAKHLANFQMDTKKDVVNEFIWNIKHTDFQDSRELKHLVNRIADDFIGDGIRNKSVIEKAGDLIRKMTGRATMGLNITPAINNEFEKKRILALVDHDSFIKANKRVLAGESFIGKYGVDSAGTTALERSSVKQAIEKYDKALYYLFDLSEKDKDNLMLAGLEEQGIKKGLEGDELFKYVIKKFDQFAIKYGKGQDIGLYKNPLIKTLFQFGQYPVKDLELFLGKSVGAFKGDKGDAKYVAKYVFASVVQMLALKAMIGTIGFGNQTNTPLDFINDIKTGDIPYSPIVNAAIISSQMLADEIAGRETDQFQKDKLKRALASSTIPMSNQLYYKTYKALENQKRGYEETSAGNIANPVSGNPFHIAKSVMFGPSYDPYRQDYINRFLDNKAEGKIGGAGLDKSESAAFKQIDDREKQRDYYQKIIDWNQKKAGKEDKGLLKIFNKAEASELNTQTPLLKKQEKSRIGDLIQYGEPVTPEELKLYYLDDYNSMPSKTKYEQNERVEEAYEVGQKIIDNEFLSQDQKNAIYKDLETSEEELSYFKVAKDTAGDKELYVEEMVETMGDDEKLEFLLTGRTVVNDKLLVSDTLINKLVKSGEITSSQGDALKSVIFVKDNSYEGEDAIKMGDNIYKPEKQTSSGSGSGFGTGNMKKVNMPIGVKRSAPKSIKITTGSSGKPYTIKVTKPNLSKRKNWRSIKLKY